jgi:uncharacterized protein with FMN-binding domain
MQNVSRRADPLDRAPSRIPRRGAAAAIGTVAGLALLLSFRTPDPMQLSGLGLSTVSGLGSDPSATDPPRTLAIAGGPNPTPTPDATRRSATPKSTSATDPAAAQPTPAPTDTPAPTKSHQVVDGKVVNTRYGPVQVEVTLSGSKVVDVQALQLPNDRQYSAEISDYVAPYLRKMALRAQSANIDIISGATYTSSGYAKSLQSALNSAN